MILTEMHKLSSNMLTSSNKQITSKIFKALMLLQSQRYRAMSSLESTCIVPGGFPVNTQPQNSYGKHRRGEAGYTAAIFLSLVIDSKENTMFSKATQRRMYTNIIPQTTKVKIKFGGKVIGLGITCMCFFHDIKAG